MGSVMESKLTPEQHAMIKKVLVAQTESLGKVESPIVEDLLARRKARSVLDIGCGEGSFLLHLARAIKGPRFVGIDQNELAIRDAHRKLRRQLVRNVTLRTAFFDAGYDRTTYDVIMTRYTLQHASEPAKFLNAVYDRLERKGTFIAIESLDAYTDSHISDPVWDRFRSSLDAIHERVGSNNNMGKSLGLLLKRAGFREIHVQVVLCAPSTVGWKRFQLVVQASADLAFAFFPDVFDRLLHEDLTAWLQNRSRVEEIDPYMTTAIASATKP